MAGLGGQQLSLEQPNDNASRHFDVIDSIQAAGSM